MMFHQIYLIHAPVAADSDAQEKAWSFWHMNHALFILRFTFL